MVSLGALAACSDSMTPVQTGGTPDAGSGSDHPDAATDGSGGAVCSGTATDVGAPSTFQSDNPVYFSSGTFFVVRDAQGLYALTARCTHEGATCGVSNGDFECPRHGALFTFDGAIISGPVSSPLKHYAMCKLANGHVGVDTTQTVSASTRLDA